MPGSRKVARDRLVVRHPQVPPRLQRQEVESELPVIHVATEDQLTPEILQTLQEPRDALLLKPFDRDTLIASVKAVITESL